MAAPESPEPFFLIGGPLHQLGRRLGLVRGTNTVALGLGLGVGLWVVIVGLALVEGVTDRLFDMSVVMRTAAAPVMSTATDRIALFMACAQNGTK